MDDREIKDLMNNVDKTYGIKLSGALLDKFLNETPTAEYLVQNDVFDLNGNISYNINIKYFDKNLPKLEFVGGNNTSDWIDLRSSETVELKQGEFKLIHLGVAMQLPVGYEAHIVPRSSTFKKWGIIQTNHQAVIDNSYCGDNDEWLYPVLAMRDTKIEKGDRICQFRIMKKMPNVVFTEVEHLGSKDRNGFGSTGDK